MPTTLFLGDKHFALYVASEHSKGKMGAKGKTAFSFKYISLSTHFLLYPDSEPIQNV